MAGDDASIIYYKKTQNNSTHILYLSFGVLLYYIILNYIIFSMYIVNVSKFIYHLL